MLVKRTYRTYLMCLFFVGAIMSLGSMGCTGNTVPKSETLGTDGGTVNTEKTPTETKTTCSTDLDCKDPNKICKEGACVDKAECSSNDECKDPAKPVCVNGTCDALPPECTVDQDCLDPARPFCKNDQCTGCQSDNDCPAGQLCDATTGKCGAKAECTSNADCKDPTKPLCKDGKCEAKGSECFSDVDCPADKSRCVDNKCTTPECSSDADCNDPTKSKCVGGVCQAECEKDADCTDGKSCVSGQCQVVSECKTDADCKDKDKPLCKNEQCVPECQVDADCANGNICIDNKCTPPPPECTTNADCQDPTKPICQNGACVARPPCKTDAECTDPAKPVCVNGICGPKTGCKSDADCAADAAKPRCVVATGQCQACATDAHCKAWQQCNTTSFTCTTRPGQCGVDKDCPQTLPYCESNKCVSCRTDANCRKFNACQSGNCVYVGCRQDTECAPQVCDKQSTQCVDCLTNANCKTGEVCTNNKCVKGPSCTKDADCAKPTPACDTAAGKCVECTNATFCPAGYKCTGGKCVNCTQDSECQSGQICLSQKCTVGCRVDRDCALGTICKANKCEKGCRVDADCPSGSSCTNNQCVISCTANNTFDRACRNSSGSANKWVCETATKSCVQCLNDRHCTSYYQDPSRPTCITATKTCGCTASTASQCPTVTGSNTKLCLTQQGRCATSCSEGLGCIRGFACLKGVCVPGGCNTDNDCGSTEFCVNNKCSECKTNAQCTKDPTKKVCNAGTCVGCAKDSDCAAGFVCDPNQNICYHPKARTQCITCATDADCATGFTCVTATMDNGTEKVCAQKCDPSNPALRCLTPGTTCGSSSNPTLRNVCWPSYGIQSSSARKSCKGWVSVGKKCTSSNDCKVGTRNLSAYYLDGFCSTIEGSECRIPCDFNTDKCPTGWQCGCPSGYSRDSRLGYVCRDSQGRGTPARCIK